MTSLNVGISLNSAPARVASGRSKAWWNVARVGLFCHTPRNICINSPLENEKFLRLAAADSRSRAL